MRGVVISKTRSEIRPPSADEDGFLLAAPLDPRRKTLSAMCDFFVPLRASVSRDVAHAASRSISAPRAAAQLRISADAQI